MNQVSELTAAPLGDLATKLNSMSVWKNTFLKTICSSQLKYVMVLRMVSFSLGHAQKCNPL